MVLTRTAASGHCKRSTRAWSGRSRPKGGKAVWRDAPGKWVVRAYRSGIDDSIQPYAVLFPHDYGKDPKKKWRLDIVLHGRDSSLTEAKFIATHQRQGAEGAGLRPTRSLRPRQQRLPLGRRDGRVRGNDRLRHCKADQGAAVSILSTANGSSSAASRWAGPAPGTSACTTRISFCVIGPGAGFTTTHGYIANLPEQLPDYQEKCLHIYDAVDYAENAFNVPIVAYSGENRPAEEGGRQHREAAEGVQGAGEVHAPRRTGTWRTRCRRSGRTKAEAEYRKYADKGREPGPKRIRFVTYTPRYGSCDWLTSMALEQNYEKAVVDAYAEGRQVQPSRRPNVRSSLSGDFTDGRRLHQSRSTARRLEDRRAGLPGCISILEKENGKWVRYMCGSRQADRDRRQVATAVQGRSTTPSWTVSWSCRSEWQTADPAARQLRQQFAGRLGSATSAAHCRRSSRERTTKTRTSDHEPHPLRRPADRTRSSPRCCRSCRSPGRRTSSSSTASSTTRRRTFRC